MTSKTTHVLPIYQQKGLKLSKNDTSSEVNQTLYRSMIGKLQYLVHSRPKIALAVGIVARFFANPRENHLIAMKRIMRYLKGIENFGLYYKKQLTVIIFYL